MRPRSEMPPSESQPIFCTTPDCYNEAFANSLCEKHWRESRKKPRGRPRLSDEEKPKLQIPELSTKKVSRIELEAMVVPILVMLGTFLDESWDPGYPVDTPQGRAIKLKPHVNSAVDQMLPWFEIYGSGFGRIMPWIGLIGGVTTLALPALEPTIEIIAGVRVPRIMRKDASDVYTEEFIRAKKAREKQKKENESPGGIKENGNGPAAADQTINTIPIVEKDNPAAKAPPNKEDYI